MPDSVRYAMSGTEAGCPVRRQLAWYAMSSTEITCCGWQAARDMEVCTVTDYFISNDVPELQD
eukprot:3395205-Rhodomonas_salina.2